MITKHRQKSTHRDDNRCHFCCCGCACENCAGMILDGRYRLCGKCFKDIKIPLHIPVEQRSKYRESFLRKTIKGKKI